MREQRQPWGDKSWSVPSLGKIDKCKNRNSAVLLKKELVPHVPTEKALVSFNNILVCALFLLATH